ncbi:hypothetical protein [Lysinibacillus sp. 3P01SB]|uniref:hypothetical protein n=1 Tax=Lysinibacillus sp. 3P01SB TaxID=3132284 RepID=UPI0039A4A7B8
MVYKARTQQGVHIILAALQMPLLGMAWDSVYLTAVLLIVVAINLIALFIKYEFIIGADDVTFTTYFLWLKLYEKRVDKNSIKQVNFKRTGWQTKSAAIKTTEGFSIRLASFAPADLFEELIHFCEKHSIPYNKTKDFLILEKMS